MKNAAPRENNCNNAGMILESMMIPIDFKKARFGQRGRDEEIENVCKTIRAAGANGVPMMESICERGRGRLTRLNPDPTRWFSVATTQRGADNGRVSSR